MKHIKDLIDSLKSHPLLLQSNIPMGYVPGLPILSIRNGYLCLIVPYVKYKVTGELDKTLVYPARHLVTISMPDGNIVSLEDLRYNPHFGQVDFGRPIGFFRHEAIAHLDKKAYMAKKKDLFLLYDQLIESLVNEQDFPIAADLAMKQLIGMLLEPSLKPAYKIFCEDFHNKYILP